MLTDEPDECALVEAGLRAWPAILAGRSTRADAIIDLANDHRVPLAAAELAVNGGQQVWATIYRVLLKQIIAVWIARHAAHNLLTGLAMVRYAQAQGFPITVQVITGPGGTA